MRCAPREIWEFGGWSQVGGCLGRVKKWGLSGGVCQESGGSSGGGDGDNYIRIQKTCTI